jgi:phage terminase large subunit GpA-like protein
MSALTAQLTQQAHAYFLEDWETDFAPRVVRPVSRWARECRIVTAGTSPLAPVHDIPYAQTEHYSPHLAEIMDSIDDPTVRILVYWGARRDGKTDLSKNVIGRTITDCPANIYDIHPTADNAALYSTTDLDPFLDTCCKGYVVEKKSRDTGRTIEFKKFKGGFLRVFSAESIAKFHGTSVDKVLIHEADKVAAEAIEKAMGRTTGFPNATIYIESTGTLAAEIDAKTGKKIYRSNIEAAYDQGDQRNWFCQCRKCGMLQRLWFDQIQYPKNHIEKAYYICERCNAEHSPAQWRDMAAGGRWYPIAGLDKDQLRDIEHTHHLARAIDPTVRSYWRNCYASLLPHHSAFSSKLHEFVAIGMKAQAGKLEAKKIWIQEDKAELWSPEEEGEIPPAWKPIYDAREDYGLVIPQGGLYLTAFVDCQLNRLEAGWRAWGRGEESWGMDHVPLAGNVRSREVWQALALELTRPWKHKSGNEIRLGMAFIDGGKWPDEVYNFFVMVAAYFAPQHPRHLDAKEFFKGIDGARIQQLAGHVRASKGFGQHGHAIVNRKMMTVGKVLKGHHIGTWEAKDRIYERLRHTTSDTPKIDPAGNGSPPATDIVAGSKIAGSSRIHFNLRYTEEYFQQLTAEQVTIVYDKGLEIRKYENPKRVRNEALDIEVGNLAAYHLHPHNLDQLEEQLAFKQEEKKKQSPAREAARSVGSGGGEYATKGFKW